MLELEDSVDKLSIIDNRGTSRQLPMTVCKYNQWMVVDANRAMGVAVRAEEEALQRRREQTTVAYHDSRQKRTAVARGQQ